MKKEKEKNVDLGRKKGSSKKEAVASTLGFTVATSHCYITLPCQQALSRFFSDPGIIMTVSKMLSSPLFQRVDSPFFTQQPELLKGRSY